MSERKKIRQSGDSNKKTKGYVIGTKNERSEADMLGERDKLVCA
jgi:hypothetical protein